MAPPSTPFSFGTPSSTSKPSSSFFTPPPRTSTNTSQQPLPFSFNSNTSSNFTPKRPTPLINSLSATGMDVDGSTDSGVGAVDEEDDDDVDICCLQPPSFKRGGKEKWVASGRAMSVGVSPVGGEVVAWITKRESNDANRPSNLSDKTLSLSDRTLFFACPTILPGPVEELYNETYTLFTSLQSIVHSSTRIRPALNAGIDARGLGIAERWDEKGQLIGIQGLLGPPGAETVGHMRRLVDLYLEEVSKLRESPEVDTETKIRFDAIYHVFYLAEILYLPQDGRGEGLLGEELLDWVNAVDTAPNNEQGNEIMQTKEPWQHPSFWPYINRCLLRGFHLPASSFLRTLQSHPHLPISKLGLLLSTHLSLFPRSHNTTSYPLDHQFLAAHRTWLGRFRAELAGFLGGRQRGKWFEEKGTSAAGGRGEWTMWEDDFRAVVELMEGRAERVLEESADWREAMGAWGVLVDVGLRRDDLPEIIIQIVDRIPVDSTVLEDSIQSSLCSGDIVKALTGCHDLDIWLSAHLGDIFDKLALIPDDEERFDIALRDYFLLEYTDLLQTNPRHAAMWRITCDYLNAAGPEGRNQLREYIQHVALDVDRDLKGKNKEQDTLNGDTVMGVAIDSGMEEESSQLRRFTQVREACAELRLEEEWKSISKILADRLVRRGEFGLAAAMCLQAEDGYALSRIAEKIVEAYLNEGDEEFLRLVDTLPPTLLAEAPIALNELQLDQTKLSGQPLDTLPNQSSMSVFASRLTFLSEFRDYLLFVQQGVKERAAGRLVNLLISGVAPQGFWGVLLVESIPLLEDSEILFSANDTFEILRILEEITSNSKYAPDDYLTQLSRHVKKSSGIKKQDDATINGIEGGGEYSMVYRKLDEVRLALARNLARALVVGFDNPF